MSEQGTDNLGEPGPDTSIDAAVAALLARDEAANDEGSDEVKQDVADEVVTPVAPEVRKYKVKVDGQDHEVDEQELINGYSFRARNTQEAQKLAEDKKAFIARDAETTEKLAKLNDILPKLEKIAQADLARYAGVDWDALKAEDPAQFTALRAEYDLDREKVDVIQRKQAETQNELQERRGREFQAFVANEFETLLEKRPEWKDEAVRTTDMKAITDYALEIGYKPEEVSNFYDHRAYLLLDKAAKYDAIMARVDKAKGRPTKTKTVAPGGRTVTTGTTEAAQTALNRVKKSGRVEDAVAALLARGGS